MHISIWEQESFYARRDVVIVGVGLAGLWCAYELLTKHPSLKLLILDSGIIPAGASTRNAGFACFGSPTELLHDANTMGEERMWQIAELRYKGIQKIRNLLGDNFIDYDNCGGFECLCEDNNNIDSIAEKLSWLNKGMASITGCRETFIIASEKLDQLGFQGFDALIENKLEGGLHSGKLVMALQQIIRSLGGEIMQGIEVKRWEEEGEEVIVFANQNIRIATAKLLLCTNALSQHLADKINIMPARGQVIVTTPIAGLRMRGTFHFDEGFYYFRNVGNRVLLGGARNQFFEDESTASFDTTQNIQNTLKQFLSDHILPRQSYEIEYKWSGVMGFTEDKQPLVKQLSERVTAVIVCNGMGVALSPMIAEEISL